MPRPTRPLGTLQLATPAPKLAAADCICYWGPKRREERQERHQNKRGTNTAPRLLFQTKPHCSKSTLAKRWQSLSNRLLRRSGSSSASRIVFWQQSSKALLRLLRVVRRMLLLPRGTWSPSLYLISLLASHHQQLQHYTPTSPSFENPFTLSPLSQKRKASLIVSFCGG